MRAPRMENAGFFFDHLPDELTGPEEDLRDAVLEFLSGWKERNGKNSFPNVVHLGSDARVRQFKVDAMPSEVPLKLWVKNRLSREVLLRGKDVVLLDDAQI